VIPTAAIVAGVIVAIAASTAVACDMPAATASSTAATLGEGLRINSQGQGDSEHSDEGDFARHGRAPRYLFFLFLLVVSDNLLSGDGRGLLREISEKSRICRNRETQAGRGSSSQNLHGPAQSDCRRRRRDRKPNVSDSVLAHDLCRLLNSPIVMPTIAPSVPPRGTPIAKPFQSN
jgi:hypothetical protein